MTYARYVAIGFAFGLVLMKSEAISWFRIQEMFRFQSFHMFGILGCAVVTAGITMRLLQRAGVRSTDGQILVPRAKDAGQRRALRDRRHVLRCGLGDRRRLPRAALRAARRRHRRDGRRDPRGDGRHVDLRDAARQAAALILTGDHEVRRVLRGDVRNVQSFRRVALRGRRGARRPARAQQPFDTSAWAISAAEWRVEPYRGRTALLLREGAAWLRGSTFQNGTIEFDIAFSEVSGFPGIAFRAATHADYELFYLRDSRSRKVAKALPSHAASSSWRPCSCDHHGDGELGRRRDGSAHSQGRGIGVGGAGGHDPARRGRRSAQRDCHRHVRACARPRGEGCARGRVCRAAHVRQGPLADEGRAHRLGIGRSRRPRLDEIRSVREEARAHRCARRRQERHARIRHDRDHRAAAARRDP